MVLTWDEYFMAVAKLSAHRSKDPHTQVGACIVSPDNRILSIGYNGTPNGWDDKDFFWGRENKDPLKTKYPYVIHAERNAILNFRGNVTQLQGATLYVTMYPCNECAKEIIQCGIKKIIYKNIPKHPDDSFEAAKILFKKCKIKTKQSKYCE